jgi:predicted nucleic acid-binding protein
LIYLDTSVVVSFYCPDANSAAAVALLKTAAEALVLTPLVELEVFNAVGLRQFRREITDQQAEASLSNFSADLHGRVFELKALPEATFLRARILSRQTTPRFGTRTGDLLHVAAALELGADRFFSFDRRQREAALAARLQINE